MLSNFLTPPDCTSTSIQATLDVIQVLYIQKSIKFDIFVYAERTPQTNCVIDGILKLSSENFTTTLNHVRDYKRWKHRFNDSAVIFNKKGTNLSKICNNTNALNNETVKNYKFLFILEEKAEIIFAHEVLSGPFTIAVFSYYLLLVKNGNFLRTTYQFMPNRCNDKTHYDNIFKRRRRWRQPLELPERFRNFHGCMIVNRMSYIRGSHYYYTGIDGKPQGLIVDIFKILEKFGNFTTYHQVSLGRAFEMNKSLTELTILPTLNEEKNESQVVIKEVIYETHNEKFLNPMVEVMDAAFHNSSIEHYHFTSVYDDTKYVFIITPGEPYNNYEKMILPFDTETWTYLLLTFALTFFIIMIVSFAPRKVQNLIFGENVWTPALNVVYIFFGLGQMKLPSKWFPRFILLMFIIFCLIFRTCYQSLLFEFMTSDMRKSSPKTIEELKERNFTLILSPFKIQKLFEQTIKGEAYEPAYKIIEWKEDAEEFANDFQFYWRQTSNYSAKLAFLWSSDDPGLQLKDLQYLDTTLMTTFRAFATFKNSIFFPLLRDAFERIIPAGIPQHLDKLHRWILYEKYHFKPEEGGPEVLTMDDLMFGYVIWLTTVGISFAIFVIEFLIWPRENKKRRKQKVRKVKNAKISPVNFDVKLEFEKFLRVKDEKEIYECFKVKTREIKVSEGAGQWGEGK